MAGSVSTLRRARELFKKEGPLSLVAHGIDRFFLESTDESVEVCTTDGIVPKWLSMGSPTIFNTDSIRGDNFRTASGNEEVVTTIEPPAPAETVEFDLIATERTKAAFVTVHHRDVDDYEESTSKEFYSGDFRGTSKIPITVSFERPAVYIEVDIDWKIDRLSNKHTECVDKFVSKYKSTFETTVPQISMPAVRGNIDAPPVFLLSIDTFRYDYIDAFEPLLQEFGDDAVVPADPRTVAESTPPTHASLFSSAYPRTHRFRQSLGVRKTPISKELPLLPELLAEAGYKCSAIVNSQISPDMGFAKAFHRYAVQTLEWRQREHDIRSKLNVLEDWIKADITHGSSGLFYFGHFFDSHYPYVTPDHLTENDLLDYELLDEFRELAFPDKGNDIDYLNRVDSEGIASEAINLDRILDYYNRGLEFVAQQLVPFIRSLKEWGIYDESLIIITGDHGEEFFERGFGMHKSINDPILRIGMIVKPPNGRDWMPPDEASILDIFPTIAETTGCRLPRKAEGDAWQHEITEPRTRFAERVRPNYYSLAVEENGDKAIFTYEYEFPEPPTKAEVQDPVLEEFYQIADVRNTNADENVSRVAEEKKEQLRESADGFLNKPVGNAGDAQQRERVSRETKAQLERLGYK
jgi:arylsulfatase A-like enzyme